MGFILFILSLIVLLITTIQIPTKKTIIPFDLGLGRKGSLTIAIPPRLRAGDPANVSILVSSTPDDVDGAYPKSLDLFSHFEIGGIEVEPKGEIHATVHPDGTLLFNWRLRTTQNATFTGNLWLFLDQGDEDPMLVYAREVSLESHRFLDLTYDLVRVAGVFGLLIGGLLSISLIQHLLKQLTAK